MANDTVIVLLPCPFCGGAVTLERTTGSYEEMHGKREWWGVVCRNTRNRGGTCAVQIIPSASQEAAVARWNMRAPAAQDKADAARPSADDMAMMIRKLARRLKKTAPDSDLPARAMDYLRRHGLEGSPLREEQQRG
jgi:hypothetical protein